MIKTKLMAKRIIKDRFCAVLSSVFFALAFGYIILRTVLFKIYGSSPLMYLSLSAETSVFAFIFFMFLSYEYFYKLKSQSAEETVKATERGIKSFYLSGLSVIFLLLLLYATGMLLIELSVYSFLKVNHTQYLVHILKAILLNNLFVPFLGILLGTLFSFFKKRASAYILMLLSVFLSTPMVAVITDALSETGSVSGVSFFRGLFDIFPPSLGYMPIYSFGLSLLSYRWEIVSFWLFALGGIVAFKVFEREKSKRIIAFTLCTVLAVCSMLGYLRPTSKVTMGGTLNSNGLADGEYYSQTEQQNEKADFSVQKYTLKMDINRLLSAEVTMLLDRNDLQKYDFTLYHGYKIEEVYGADKSKLNLSNPVIILPFIPAVRLATV